jgi:hypothetical protein
VPAVYTRGNPDLSYSVVAGPLSLAAEQELEWAFALPVAGRNQADNRFRLTLQDAETGVILAQKEVQGAPGGGCLEMMVDENGNVSIDDQPADFSIAPGEHKEVIGLLQPLHESGQTVLVATLQLVDPNSSGRTFVALPALQ